MLQYRKRYELLQLVLPWTFILTGTLQYRKRYELLQLRFRRGEGGNWCWLQYRKRYELLQQRCLGGLDFTGLKWCFSTVFALLEDILHFIPLIPKHLAFVFATNPVRVRLQGVFLVMVPSQRWILALCHFQQTVLLHYKPFIFLKQVFITTK